MGFDRRDRALDVLAFRSPLPIGLVILSLGVGMLGALSVSAMTFTKLHIITFVFGASLVGVAQDYGVLYLCRHWVIAATPGRRCATCCRR